MAAKQEAEEVAEQVKMAEEEKTGSAPESAAEASTKVEEEHPTFEQPEEVEAREVTSVVDAEQVPVIADEKREESVEETSVAEEPKETVEEAPVKEVQEGSTEEHEKKEETAEKIENEEGEVEKDGETNESTEQTQDQGDSAGDVVVAKDEETASETVQEMAKESQDQTKEETPVKPVKQSSNLISKVKNSLVKAKKAIIGKSPPKSDAAETKE